MMNKFQRLVDSSKGLIRIVNRYVNPSNNDHVFYEAILSKDILQEWIDYVLTSTNNSIRYANASGSDFPIYISKSYNSSQSYYMITGIKNQRYYYQI